MRGATLVGLLLVLLGVAAQAQTRVELPIRESRLGLARRYSITIKVGDTEIETGLDTGSTGLRILPGVLKAADAKGNGDSIEYGYESGTKLIGETGKGSVGFGGISGPAEFQLIHGLDCTGRRPNCAVRNTPMDSFGIMNDGIAGAGFKAIIGINMSGANVDNPLLAIGVKRWIVELPRGDGQPGRLILNPTDADVKDFSMLPILESYHRGGLHDAVAGCLLNRTTQASACGAMLLDSGAPGIGVYNTSLGRQWQPNSPAALGFYDGHTPRAMETFTSGTWEQASRLNFESNPAMRGIVILAGLSPYLAFDVLYDTPNRAIGLKPRPASGNNPTGIVTPN